MVCELRQGKKIRTPTNFSVENRPILVCLSALRLLGFQDKLMTIPNDKSCTVIVEVGSMIGHRHW